MIKPLNFTILEILRIIFRFRGFFIDTKSAGSYNFVVKNAGKTLKTMRDFLGNEKIVRNKPVLSLKRVFEWFKRKNKKYKGD